MTVELVQGSDEWRQARCGSLGASRISDAVARIKSGWGASRANLAAELIIERLTGVPTDGYMNEAMRWGQEQEPHARAAYEFLMNTEVQQVGLVRHPCIDRAHASPDGLIGDDGVLEIKCPQSATHLETLMGTPIPDKYIKQVNWQMACTGRSWTDWISYDPRLPAEMQLFVQRVMRDDTLIKVLEGEVRTFLAEVDEKVATLRARYMKEAA